MNTGGKSTLAYCTLPDVHWVNMGRLRGKEEEGGGGEYIQIVLIWHLFSYPNYNKQERIAISYKGHWAQNMSQDI